MQEGQRQLIGALVYYLAESLRRAVPAARRVVFHADVSRYIDESQPVLTGSALQIDLVGAALDLVGPVYFVVNPDAPNTDDVPPLTEDDLREAAGGT